MKCWLLFGVLKDKQINCDTDAWDDGMDLGWDGMDAPLEVLGMIMGWMGWDLFAARRQHSKKKNSIMMNSITRSQNKLISILHSQLDHKECD